MANTATNISTGKPKLTGGVWVAPRTATLPTDATTALSADYKCLGYVSEDGLNNNNELDVSEIKAWGGNIVYRSQNGMDDTFGLSLIETKNTEVLKTVYGSSNVSVDGSGNVTVNVVAEDPQELIWVFEIVLRGGTAKRIVIPDGAITARDEITYNDSDAIAYGITVSAYPDSNGKTHVEYIEGDTTTSFTVTFNSNGGSAVAPQSVLSGQKATEPTDPTKDGYTFDDWYLPTDLSTPFDFANTTITADITLYAKWTS